jgi:hypothetical protein
MVKPEDLTTVSSFLGNMLRIKIVNTVCFFDSFVIFGVVNAFFFVQYQRGNFGDVFLYITFLLTCTSAQLYGAFNKADNNVGFFMAICAVYHHTI